MQDLIWYIQRISLTFWLVAAHALSLISTSIAPQFMIFSSSVWERSQSVATSETLMYLELHPTKICAAVALLPSTHQRT